MKMTRITSTAFRAITRRSQYQYLLSNKQNNVCLYRSTLTRNFFKDPTTRQTDVLSGNSPKDWMVSALPMRYVYVNTGQNRWEDIPDGFLFDTGYADSHPDSTFNPNVPLILAIHDMYGGHEPLLPLLAPLVLKNYRVIAINFPGTNHTNGVGRGHDDGFLHTTDEYAEFIGDFLEQLKIPKVDLMLGYGTGCYPTLRFCAKTDICRSAALLCPAGHVPYKGIQPYKLYDLLVQFWETPFLRPYLKVFTFLFKHLKGLGKYKVDEVVTSFKIIRGIDFNSIGSYIFNLKHNNFPVGVLYCTKDPQIETVTSQKFCELLGVEEKQMTFYDKDGQITKQANENSKRQVIVLEEKSINIWQDFHLPIIKMIEKLVNLVHQRM